VAFEAFSEPDYRRFWTTQFISNVGSWMQAIAQGWLVYRLTDSPFLLGFVAFANSIPTLFLMLPGGVLADHLDRRRVVKVSQWAQALCALFLAISIRTGQITVWQIVAAAIVVGTAISFSAPAYQAMVVDLLDDRRNLPNAVAMNSLQFNLSRAIGPLLAGATLAAWGPFWCFFSNALSFLPLIWVLGRLKARQQTPSAAGIAVWARFREGLAYVRRDRPVALALAIVAAASFFGYPYMNLMPIVARALFRNDATGLGYLMGAIGAGSLLGALSISVRTPGGRRMMPAILGSMVFFGTGLAIVAFLRAQAIVLVMLFVCGATMVTCTALANTSIQQRVPDDKRGRILSMYTFCLFAFLPFGNLLSGVVAEHYGIRLTLGALGGGLIVSALAAGAAARD
jgi:MFS family permease